MAEDSTSALLERMYSTIYYKDGCLYWAKNRGYCKKDTRVGSLDKKGYRCVTLFGKYYLEHQLIWFIHNNVFSTNEIDHINHIRDDNRIENLREVTRIENMRNKTKYKNNTSSVTGVSKHQGRWRARINIEGKEKLIGVFDTFEEACEKRAEVERAIGFHFNHGKALKMKCPIYFNKNKGVKVLLSLNWLQDAHYRSRNKIKQEYHMMIGKVLPKGLKLNSPVATHYKVFYKNSMSDAPNIVGVVDKFLLDALQEHKAIEQDNVQHYIRSSWEVVGQDRDNPRIEVEVKEI